MQMRRDATRRRGAIGEVLAEVPINNLLTMGGSG